MKKLRKQRNKVCPYCEGQGWVQSQYDDMFGYVGTHEETCPDCESKGKIYVVKKHCIDCGDKFYAEKHVKRCAECNHVHLLKDFETSLQDDKWGFMP